MGVYDEVIGTLLVGIFFNTYLYGLVTYQFMVYYNSPFKDPAWIRVFVGILVVLDTFHTAATIYMAWEYCVTNFDNPAILTVALWPYTFTPIGTALAAFLTQIFLGYRMYRLTGQLYLFIILLVFAITSFALGVTCGVKAWIIEELAKLPVLDGLVTAWLAMQMGIDLYITIALCWILSQAKTKFRATDTVINRLMRGAIQTGVFATIFSLGDLAAFLALPHTNIYGMFAIPLGRIYTNTLMDTLLMREGLREVLARSEDGSGMDPNSSIWGRSTGNRGLSRISFNKSIHQSTTGRVVTNPGTADQRDDNKVDHMYVDREERDIFSDVKPTPSAV
ncbi:hypothetical protein BDN71DRAFT_1507106 [Pleurotus eryngii]|uniref:DUF6534 domain-containing protein n=1 Tax=Pleurotus eryngii TaxID=5323 RepID=A0A9P5ZVY3_PLEER|nr:hypothetical protein BDN71DRAFT_1507106 [Pleurotus eryngii]